MKAISQFIEKRPKRKTQFIQARVDLNLRRRVEAKLKKHNQTWVDLVKAACKAYLQE